MSAQAQPDVEFLLLGPLEARYRQRSLRLGSIKHRMILAKLLLHPNQVVSTDELIDTVWGAHPPATVRQSLQNHVAALRKAIEPDSRGGQGRMLRTRDPGYMIEVTPGQIDLNRFEQLVEQGRRALADDQPIEAAGLLHRALGLWRGPALADVVAASDLDWPEIIGLEDQRIAAREACIEADLALGRHADLVGELKSLVRQHPLREQLHGHLMLALYRSGRQAEALAAYRTARQNLIDELGIEPSVSLQRLEQAILAQDAALELLTPVRPMVRLEEPAASPTPAAPEPAAAPLPPSTERKLVTVLFADVDEPATGEYAERDPEDVSAMLAAHLERVRAQVERFDGSIEHAVGGTTMAVFGVPRTREDDPERAVRAALAIREALLSPSGAAGSPSGGATATAARPSVQLRIAVVTGEALVKTGDGEGRIMGDLISTGARLQQAAPIGTVLVSEATERATARAINYGPPSLLSLGGRAKPVTVWSALQPRNRTGLELTLTRAGGAPLIGRERELAMLVDSFEAVRGGGPARMVALVGPPGIGKSRLIAELGRLVEADPELIAWRVGRSLPYGEATTFGALAEIVKSEANILDTDSAARIEQKLAQAAAYAIPDDQTTAEWVAGHLRLLVGTTGGEPLDKSRQEEAITAWCRFLFGLAARRTLVLVVEDLHQADDALLDFLTTLADPSGVAALSMTNRPGGTKEPNAGAGNPRLLVIVAARPALLERRPAWRAEAPPEAGSSEEAAGAGRKQGLVELIELGPLSQDETTHLLDTLLVRHGFSGTVNPELLSRVAGNPLFAEEYVRMLRDRRFPTGGLVSDQYAPAELRQPLPALPLPETVHAIIAARLDALPVEEKVVLQDAAILGHAGWVGALATVSGLDRAVVETALRRLEEREFIRWVPRSSITGELEYEFRHILVRDVAYGQIPRAGKAGKHRRAAGWLEALGGDGEDGRPGDRAELLAYHYQQALTFARVSGGEDPDLIERARLAFKYAGDRVAGLGVYLTAAKYYMQAVDLWPEDSPELPELLLRAGEARCYGDGGGEELLEQALEGFRRLGNTEHAAEAEARLAHIKFFLHGQKERGLHVERALALVHDAPPSRSKAMVLESCMMHYVVSDQHDEAIRIAHEAIEVARAVGDPRTEASAFGVIGAARVGGGDPAGIADLERCIKMAQDNRLFIVTGWSCNLAEAYAMLGQLHRSREAKEDAWRAAKRFGLVRELRWIELGRMADCYWGGQWDEAMEIANLLTDESVSKAIHYLDAPLRVWRGRICLARGETDAALDDADQALRLAREVGDPQVLEPALTFGARAMLAAGRAEEAQGLMQELLPGLGDKLLKPDLGVDLAVSLSRLGHSPDVLDAITLPSPWLDAARSFIRDDPRQAAIIYAQMGSRPDEAYARLEAARRLPAGEAKIELDAAIKFYREVNATAYLNEAEVLRLTYA